MKVYEAVARTLGDAGVDHFFGLMGNANMEYISAYRDLAAGKFESSVHEAGAVSMADGYARMTGRVGVVSVTHGPGVTNALTALTEAVRGHTPLLALVGDPATQEHISWLDLRAAAALVGAGYYAAETASGVVPEIRLALNAVWNTRRPALLNIPVSIMHTEIDYSPERRTVYDRLADDALTLRDEVLDRALGIIASAARPVILAGRGAVVSGAREELIALAETLHAPLATTLMAKDCFAGHPLDLGLFGTMSHSLAVRYLSQSDCVIVFGAGLNGHTTASGDLIKGKAVVRCDNDINALMSRGHADVNVLADARAFARAVTSGVAALEQSGASVWIEQLRKELAEFSPKAQFKDQSSSEFLDPRAAMVTLNEMLPADRAVVTDGGRFHPAPWRLLRASPGAFTSTISFGSIGLALGTAIGASSGRRDRLTVCVAGDGGAIMGLMELATAVNERLPLLVVVLNDGAYGAEWTKLEKAGLNPRYSLHEWPSFAAVAAAIGAHSAVVRNVEELRALKSELMGLDSPFVIEILTDPEVNPKIFL